MDINKVNAANLSKHYDPDSINTIKKTVPDEFKKDINNQKEKKVNSDDVRLAVEKANKVLFKNNTHLQFRIHDKTNEVMVKIIDDVTGDVLKEIPPEKMLDMVAKLWEIAGILVDEKR